MNDGRLGVAAQMEEVDPAICDAIQEAITAGVFWTAARHNPKSALVWETMAEEPSGRARALVARAMKRWKTRAPNVGRRA